MSKASTKKKGRKVRPEKRTLRDDTRGEKKRTPRNEKTEKKRVVKEAKKAAKHKNGKPPRTRMTLSMNDHVIRRLEKPTFYSNSPREDLWNLLRKGMTIGEYVSAGGTRNMISQWVKKGNVKLIER